MALMLPPLATVPASATDYTISLVPSSVPSGARATIDARIMNVGAASVGSANLMPPAGFSIVSAKVAAGKGTATVADNTARLRQLDIDRGASAVARLTVDVPCSPTSAARWTAVVKESGRFLYGALPSDGSDAHFTTTTTGACSTDGTATCEANAACTTSASITGIAPGGAPYRNTVTVDAPENPDTPSDGGTLTAAYNTSPNFSCAGYSAASPDREVIFGPNRVKIVTSRVAASLLAASGRAAGSLRTCLVAPFPFKVGLLAGQASAIGDFDDDGNTDYIGLLPKCLQIVVGPPCQVSAKANAAGDGVVIYKLPADPRDPMARH